MSEPGLEPPPNDNDTDPEPGMVLATGTIIYGAMGGAALLWLWSRDRWDALVVQSIGQHGPFVSSAVGLIVGLCGAWFFGIALKRFTSLQDVATAAHRLFARAGDGVAIAFVLISAVAEELFFRLAVQDVFGVVGSVAVYVLLNSSVGGLRWIAFTFVHALVLGLIVHFGFGLLGSATAHAILNYLSLRRIQDS
jgi:membrane protease YdiL (CAAX protease family)